MRLTCVRPATAGVAMAAGLSGGPAAAQEAASFYDDNVIQWIVPYNPGGGYDEYSRAIAPYLEKYTGARIDLVNQPGAGGMKGANEIFTAPADGLTIGIINGVAMVANELSGRPGAKFKIAEYNYLGRIASDVRVLAISTDLPWSSLDDLAASEDPIILGATGLGGSIYVDSVVTGQALGLEQRVINGFDNSSDVRQAMLRGDVQGMWGSLGSALQGQEDGEHIIVAQSERERSPLLPDVPSVFEYTGASDDPDEAEAILNAWDAMNAVGRPVVAPPGVPDDRLAFLRDAFTQAMEDPDFIEMMKSADRELAFADGARIADVARSATEMTPEVEAVMVEAFGGTP